ncbi:MAG: hypothetical protein WCH75_16135 [Candidatus Binatia bacterium]|jgi:hypothetical protein
MIELGLLTRFDHRSRAVLTHAAAKRAHRRAGSLKRLSFIIKDSRTLSHRPIDPRRVDIERREQFLPASTIVTSTLRPAKIDAAVTCSVMHEGSTSLQQG